MNIEKVCYRDFLHSTLFSSSLNKIFDTCIRLGWTSLTSWSDISSFMSSSRAAERPELRHLPRYVYTLPAVSFNSEEHLKGKRRIFLWDFQIYCELLYRLEHVHVWTSWCIKVYSLWDWSNWYRGFLFPQQRNASKVTQNINTYKVHASWNICARKHTTLLCTFRTCTASALYLDLLCKYW